MDRSSFFDTHVHLLDSRLAWLLEDTDEEAGGMICVFQPGEDSALFKKLIKRPNIWGIAGIHPHDSRHYACMEEELKDILGLEEIVGLGEIGLDFHYDNSPRDIQRDVFMKQLQLAVKKDLPVIVHTRNSFEETLEILSDSPAGPVLIHCFPGGPDDMAVCIERGYYIALGGIVTFSNAGATAEVAKEIPIERLLLETDSPYLAPQPCRGKPNRPAYIEYIAERIAHIRQIDTGELIDRTRRNAIGFFGLSA